MNNKSFLDHMADVIKQKPKFPISDEPVKIPKLDKSEYKIFAQTLEGVKLWAEDVSVCQDNYGLTTWTGKVVSTELQIIDRYVLVNPEYVILCSREMETPYHLNSDVSLLLNMTITWGSYSLAALTEYAKHYHEDRLLLYYPLTGLIPTPIKGHLTTKDLQRLGIV